MAQPVARRPAITDPAIKAAGATLIRLMQENSDLERKSAEIAHRSAEIAHSSAEIANRTAKVSEEIERLKRFFAPEEVEEEDEPAVAPPPTQSGAYVFAPSGNITIPLTVHPAAASAQVGKSTF